MPASSEARIQANRQNAQRSTGPKTIEGKAQSRRNGLKHGLTGSGVVQTDQDASEVATRSRALLDELQPRSTLGRVLVGQLATLSVRMERGAKQEEAAIASRVRHSAEVFDRERSDRAEALFVGLAEAPRETLRELARSPEGVDRLTLALTELRDDLTRSPRPLWSYAHFEKLANLVGFVPDDPRAADMKGLSQAAWGYFGGLTEDQGAGLDAPSRQAWARDRLLERIDAELAALAAQRASLDLEAIELDRIGAADIALFDPSREAALARRYEAEARRGFFKALKEFRAVELEAAETMPTPGSETVETPDPLASSWAGPSPTLREPKPGAGMPFEMATNRMEGVARGLDGRVVAIGRSG